MDIDLRAIERLLSAQLQRGYEITQQEFATLRRLREFENLAREQGGVRRALQYLTRQGRPLQRAELRAMIAVRDRIIAALRLIKGSSEADQLAVALARRRMSLGMLRFSRAANLLRFGGYLALLLIAIGIGMYVYDHYTKSNKQVASADIPNCDCSRVQAGILTGPWQDDCRNSEKVLKAATASCRGGLECVRQALNLKSGQNGQLVSGQFCGNMRGDYAWPVEGAPVVPPPIPGGPKPCLKRTGLAQTCSDE